MSMYSAGQSLGSYTILRPLASGRAVDVYEALHQEQQRRVALKVLQSKYQASEESVSRFLTEYRALNCLVHPAIAETYECGRLADGVAFAATELIAGETLSARLERPLSYAEGLLIARQIASILTMAHSCGILHRDLRPEHVLLCLDPDTAALDCIRVVDFGVARIAEEAGSRLPQVGEAEPSRYTAPEQGRRSLPLGPKADVYAFGAMLQDLLRSAGGSASGSAPGSPSSPDDPKASVSEPEPSSRSAPSQRDEISTLIGRMLATAPSERPTMREVRAQLERLWRSLPERSDLANWNRAGDATGDTSAVADKGAELGSVPSFRPGEDDVAWTEDAVSADAPAADPSTQAAPSRLGAAPLPRLALLFAALGLAMGVAAGGLAYRRAQLSRSPTAPAAPDVASQQPVLASLLTVVVDPVAAPSAPPTVLEPPPGMMTIAGAAGAGAGGGTPSAALWVDKADVNHAAFAAWLNTADVVVRKDGFVYLADRRVLDLRAKRGGLRLAKDSRRPTEPRVPSPAAPATRRFIVRLGQGETAVRYVDSVLAQAYCAARAAQLPTPAQVNWLLRHGVASAAVWGAPLSLSAAHGFRCLREAKAAE